LNATGFEEGLWLDPLQNASKCGFAIHGKLIINSNRSNATFSVSYTTESGSSKSVTASVGTSYISDVKYGASMTVTPNALSGYTWEKASTTITYNGATTVTLNAYIYPSSVTISGDSAIRDGNSATYTASISPSNVDIGFTYIWSLSNSANAFISSSSGNQCTIATQPVTTVENLILTCVVTTTDGKKVQKTFTIELQTKPNFILATYNITSTTTETQLVYASFSYLKSVIIDGQNLGAIKKYKFSSTGLHTVKITVTNPYQLFYSYNAQIPVVSVDLSQCDGEQTSFKNFASFASDNTSIESVTFGDASFPYVDNMNKMFDDSTSLKIVDFGRASFPSVTNNFGSLFMGCSSLSTVIWEHASFPSVTSLDSIFYNCKSLKSVSLEPFKSAPVSRIGSTFNGCESLESIDLSPLSGKIITYMGGCFFMCKSLTSIDLTPLSKAEISGTNTGNTFGTCLSLKTLIVPWAEAPQMQSNTFGQSTTTYAGRNTYNKKENKLYVPAGATGYNTGCWLDPLQNSSKCGFTLSATL
jgi:hypothetical protein